MRIQREEIDKVDKRTRAIDEERALLRAGGLPQLVLGAGASRVPREYGVLKKAVRSQFWLKNKSALTNPNSTTRPKA